MNKLKVCMFVYNNFTKDARVLKEATTLAKNGYDVRVIAVLDNTTTSYEEQNGFRIIRLEKNPLHYRILLAIKNFSLIDSVKRMVRPLRSMWHTQNQPKVLHSNKEGFLRKAFNGCSNFISDTRSKIKKCEESLRKFAGLALTLGWFFVILYKLIRFIWKAVYWGLYKPMVKIGFKVRKLYYRFIRRPARYVWYRIIKKGFYWGIRRPLRLFWHRVIKKAIYWGIKLPLRKLKNYIYNVMKKVLMVFHRPLCFIDFYFRSYQVVVQEPADVYHGHDLNTLPAAWWARRRLGGKLVYDSHELYTETSSLPKSLKILAALVERLIIKKCDHVITVCDSIATELVNRYKITRPTVIMNCPNLKDALGKHNLIREALELPIDLPIILYQGGFSHNRGLYSLIKASKSFKKGILVMMGWGRIEDELKALVEQEGLGEKVRFIPPASQEDLLYWSSSADVGVIPYQFVGLNNYYSCPNKLFEYIAAGLAVTGSYFPELTKIIEGNKIGYTFDPESPQGIADAVNRVLEDDLIHKKMCSNAEGARLKLNWGQESLKLLSIYREFSVPASNLITEESNKFINVNIG